MPVKIPNALPATSILTSENIFVMTEKRASTQDIRPLHIAIVNLMPTKIDTETQLLRLLGNTSIQIEVTLIKTATYVSTHTSPAHMSSFYRTFNEINGDNFDGLIITGAPVEHLAFKDVNYWEELKQIMEWSKHHVYSTLHICWAAQAGLFYHHGIEKRPMTKKVFGIFSHRSEPNRNKLLHGFDDEFKAPHSRHTEILVKDILSCDKLELLAESDEAGVLLVSSHDNRQVYVTGHMEYDAKTLDIEYKRDLAKGLDIEMPKHYYPNDDSNKTPSVSWRAHANLLFANWLNYYVYQETPYDLYTIK